MTGQKTGIGWLKFQNLIHFYNYLVCLNGRRALTFVSPLIVIGQRETPTLDRGYQSANACL